MEIKKVGVIGCGLMGGGITQVCAYKGYETVVVEINDELLEKGLGKIKKFLEKSVSKGKISQEDMDNTISRIKPSTTYDAFKDCQLVIEAVPENLDLKKKVFGELDSIVPEGGILASNTSSISIAGIASSTKRPENVIGLHFFQPVPIMNLIEIVRSFLTSEDTYSKAKAFGESLGKKIVTAKDSPGFIVNRLLIPYLLDSIRALDNGIASKEDIDTAMKLGCNMPMGPLELTDFIGLDTTLFIAESIYEEYKDMRYVAPPILHKMVIAGHTGRKSGKGFYDYVN